MWKARKFFKAQESIKIVQPVKETLIKYPYKVCICGVIRDGEPYFKTTISNLKKIGSLFQEYKIIVIESDSKDQTIHLYSSINDKNIIFYSMGELEKDMPAREERIASCRNIYVNHILKNYKHYDLMIVVDLDDVLQETINPKIFDKCMSQLVYPTWDAVFANQSYRYYDIWALRNDEVNYDCWEKIVSREMTRDISITNHQYHIPKNTPYIPVKSAFGGMGIYKIKLLDDTTIYNAKDGNFIRCEHVSFNDSIVSKGGKLFIDPSMVLETPVSFSKYYS